MSALRLICGDALSELRKLPDASVHCCVTSPPYCGLRNYGMAGQVGLEKTPQEYVSRMVEIFEEVRRVLRPDGSLWLNLGDSYANNSQSGGGDPTIGTRNLGGTRQPKLGVPPRLKPKDLIGIPWLVAFALQAAGWYLRCDIIWFKPNPMPESVTDRPTKSHEYIFLLTKNARYFYDAEAIKEQVLQSPPKMEGANSRINRSRDPQHEREYDGKNRRMQDQWSGRRLLKNVAEARANGGAHDSPFGSQRNKRSVWSVATAPYGEAHFATFPPDLIKPCILAGTSAAGCCDKCGAPLERVTEKGAPNEAQKKACGADSNGGYNGTAQKDYGAAHAQDPSAVKARILAGMRERITVAWEPTCGCFDGVVQPCTVLDPFGGSGTTGMVSLERGRRAILIELNPEYVRLAEQRCNITAGLPL
jgi:DNA modification methylase